jgi:hypothetical protein
MVSPSSLLPPPLPPYVCVCVQGGDKVANIRQRTGICLQLLSKLKGVESDAKVQEALNALTNDKDIEVLRSTTYHPSIYYLSFLYSKIGRPRKEMRSTKPLIFENRHRTMGQHLQVGLTSNKHLGLSNGAERDAEVCKANNL